MFFYAILILLPVAMAFTNQNNNDVIATLFNLCDRNQDGILTRSDLQDYFRNVDTIRNGQISHQELTAAIARVNPFFTVFEGFIFTFLDLNKNGRLEPSDVDELFNFANTNRDDRIDVNEIRGIYQTGINNFG